MAAPSPSFTKPKIIEKVFDIPIVLDAHSLGCVYVWTYGSLIIWLPPVWFLTTSLHPYLSSSLASLSSLQANVEERLPQVAVARGQVYGGVNYLDNSLCYRLEQLLDYVPSLNLPTPTLYDVTAETAVSRLTEASSYLASFTLGQLALRIVSSGLECAGSLVEQAPASFSSCCEPLVSGLRTVCGQVDRVRREGARTNSTEKAKMESSSLLCAVSDEFGLHQSPLAEGKEVVAEEEVEDEVAEEVVKDEVSEEVVKDEVSEEVVKDEVPEEGVEDEEGVKEVEEVLGWQDAIGILGQGATSVAIDGEMDDFDEQR